MRWTPLALVPLMLLACRGSTTDSGVIDGQTTPAPVRDHLPAVDPDSAPLELTLLGLSNIHVEQGQVVFDLQVRVTDHALGPLWHLGHWGDHLLVNPMAESESGQWHFIGIGICGTGLGERQISAGLDQELMITARVDVEDPLYFATQYEGELLEDWPTSPGTGRAKVTLGYRTEPGGPWFEASTEPFDIPQPPESKSDSAIEPGR